MTISPTKKSSENMADKDKTAGEVKDGGLFFDPANYRKMADPFSSIEDASDAIDSFWRELYELRNKHRIRDVHLILECDVVRNDGSEGTTILSGHIGDENKAEIMVGFAFGQVQADRQDRVAKTMAGKFVTKLPKRK